MEETTIPLRKVRQTCKPRQEEESLPFQKQSHHIPMWIPLETHITFHDSVLSPRNIACNMTLGEYFKYKHATAIHRRIGLTDADQYIKLISKSPKEYDTLTGHLKMTEEKKGAERFFEIRAKADALQNEWTKEARRRQFIDATTPSREVSPAESSTGSSGYVKVRTPMRLLEPEESSLPPLPKGRKFREQENEVSVQKAVAQEEESPSTTNSFSSEGQELGSKEELSCWRKLLKLFSFGHSCC